MWARDRCLGDCQAHYHNPKGQSRHQERAELHADNLLLDYQPASSWIELESGNYCTPHERMFTAEIPNGDISIRSVAYQFG